MATNVYRQMWPATSNVPEDRRLVGVFSVAASGSAISLGTFVRPSAGSAATTGLGNMFTVTQPSAGTADFFVSTAEKIYQECAAFAQVQLRPDDGTAAATAPAITNATYAGVQTSRYDSTTGGFWVCLLNADGSKLTVTKSPPTGYTWRVSFEVVAKPTISPASL